MSCYIYRLYKNVLLYKNKNEKSTITVDILNNNNNRQQQR